MTSLSGSKPSHRPDFNIQHPSYLTDHSLGSLVTTTTMADQQQPTDTHGLVEQEPLTGLNIISDATTKGNTSQQSNALAEIDLNSASNFNSNISVSTTLKPAADPKQVSIAEPNEETSGVNENLEVALAEGDDHEDRVDDDVGGAGMQMEVGGIKKKSKKKKPKSKRGRVRY